jgi:hypothetical protein
MIGARAVFRAIKPVYLLAREGVIHTLERRAGISTTGIITPEELGFSSEHRVRYQASHWFTLRRILPLSEVAPDDIFVEFGSGMGRVLYQAAVRYPFRRIEGIELSPKLMKVAKHNLDTNRHKFRCQDIRLVTCDALDYEIPDDLTIAYFYNPFCGPIFQDVVDRLVASVVRTPRRLRLIYLNPVEEDMLLRSGFRQVRLLRGYARDRSGRGRMRPRCTSSPWTPRRIGH